MTLGELRDALVKAIDRRIETHKDERWEWTTGASDDLIKDLMETLNKWHRQNGEH